MRSVILEVAPDDTRHRVDPLIQTVLGQHLAVPRHRMQNRWRDIGCIETFPRTEGA